MKINIKIQVITLLISILTTTIAGAEVFKAGKHYKILNTPLNTTSSNGHAEVVEIFWYYCPHCNNLEPDLNIWLAKKSDDINFIRIPAIFSKRWESGAIFYYVLEELGLLDKLHSELFSAIHEDNVIFSNKEDFIDWLSLFGVDKKKSSKVFSSFSVNSKTRKAKIYSKKSKVAGVPSFVINGKYTTGVREAGSVESMFKVIDYLVAKDRKKATK